MIKKGLDSIATIMLGSSPIKEVRKGLDLVFSAFKSIDILSGLWSLYSSKVGYEGYVRVTDKTLNVAGYSDEDYDGVSSGGYEAETRFEKASGHRLNYSFNYRTHSGWNTPTFSIILHNVTKNTDTVLNTARGGSGTFADAFIIPDNDMYSVRGYIANSGGVGGYGTKLATITCTACRVE